MNRSQFFVYVGNGARVVSGELVACGMHKINTLGGDYAWCQLHGSS